MIRTVPFQCRGAPSSIPGQGTEIPQVSRHGQKKKKTTQSTVIVRVKNFLIFLPKRRNEKEIGNLASPAAALRQIAASLDNELAPPGGPGLGAMKTGYQKIFFNK